MYPTIETIREIAAKGQYKRVPVCREVYADRYTPVEVMRTLRKASRHCYLLESASQTEVWGRYSFLGYEPAMEITCTDGAMKIRRTEGEDQGEITKQVAHPGDTLREILKEYKSPVIEDMPMTIKRSCGRHLPHLLVFLRFRCPRQQWCLHR